MDILDLRNYILSLPLVEECQPFGDDVVVYKIGGRMFACYILQHTERIAVKCEPERAIELRDEYIDIITPAYHFNKRHWNDLRFELLPRQIVEREICHSYLTVIRKNVTPKALSNEILAIVNDAGIKDVEINNI